MKSKLIIFIAAALLPNFALADDDAQKLSACITRAQTDAEGAYVDGLRWRMHDGRLLAEECIAFAKIGLGQYESAGLMFLGIANAPDGGNTERKTTLFVKSANAFILAGLPDPAISALNQALELKPDDADILIDRSRAYGELEKWENAEKDLDRAMQLRGPLGFALRLRAETLARQNKFDEALRDIEQAISLEPKEVENYVERGRIREAKRLGHLID